jgi:chemotaxis protein CheX
MIQMRERKGIMAQVKTAKVPAQDRPEWVPILELATSEVFELMLSSKLTKPSATPAATFSVTAMVGLAGLLSGVMNVRCEEKAAALAASKMLGMELDQVGPEIADALGEVCSMVAGNFKNKVPGLGDGCMLSPPSVITGGDYTVHSQPDTPSIEVVLMFEGMPIMVSLHIYT